MLQRVSRQALNEFTDASNNLSDNIASLEHGKPILKPHAACFFFSSNTFSTKVCWCNTKRRANLFEKIGYKMNEGKKRELSVSKKNTLHAKEIGNAFVVVCVVFRWNYMVIVSLVSCLYHKNHDIHLFSPVSLFAFSIIQKIDISLEFCESKNGIGCEWEKNRNE